MIRGLNPNPSEMPKMSNIEGLSLDEALELMTRLSDNKSYTGYENLDFIASITGRDKDDLIRNHYNTYELLMEGRYKAGKMAIELAEQGHAAHPRIFAALLGWVMSGADRASVLKRDGLPPDERVLLGMKCGALLSRLIETDMEALKRLEKELIDRETGTPWIMHEALVKIVEDANVSRAKFWNGIKIKGIRSHWSK
jgi:hypothetical protein